MKKVRMHSLAATVLCISIGIIIGCNDTKNGNPNGPNLDLSPGTNGSGSATPPPAQKAPYGDQTITSKSCDLVSKGLPDNNTFCPAAPSHLIPDVENAANYAMSIDGVMRDGRVYDVTKFKNGVISYLDSRNLCSGWGSEELYVRQTGSGAPNEHEQFKIVNLKLTVKVEYKSTCAPALEMPHYTAPPVIDVSCGLEPSHEFGCIPEGYGTYHDEIFQVLDEMLADERQNEAAGKPYEIFDLKSHSGSENYIFKIINVPAYRAKIEKKLRERNFCVDYSGEELALKRGSNQYSEQWDLIGTGDYSIRSYKTSCHAAAFINSTPTRY